MLQFQQFGDGPIVPPVDLIRTTVDFSLKKKSDCYHALYSASGNWETGTCACGRMSRTPPACSPLKVAGPSITPRVFKCLFHFFYSNFLPIHSFIFIYLLYHSSSNSFIYFNLFQLIFSNFVIVFSNAFIDII